MSKRTGQPLLTTEAVFFWQMPLGYPACYQWLRQHGFRRTAENIRRLQEANPRRAHMKVTQYLSRMDALKREGNMVERQRLQNEVQDILMREQVLPIIAPTGLDSECADHLDDSESLY